MSGHSKWSTIRHKKAATDAKRGKLFTKLVKEIMVAAKQGGGDIEMNPRLRTAVDVAKSQNMPMDNIERAVKKGTGELEGVNYVEVTYEGYGPDGIAVLIDVLTDNKNRTQPELRLTFHKKGGSISEQGSVSWMFDTKGLIVLDHNVADEDDLMEIVLEAGAENLESDGQVYEVITSVADFDQVKQVLEDKNISWNLAELTKIPQNMIKVSDAEKAKKLITLFEALEEHDDVQKLYSNADIEPSILENLS
ncbi:transcriptional regulator [PVC group bacterium (ex Bugula neritina AB1)]|nr:transcriptional regulator [PVC group bacterium (ex Bugula neritina AB1)]